MSRFASAADRDAIEREMPWDERNVPLTLYGLLDRTAKAHGRRKAVSFQLFSSPKAPAETLTWTELHDRVAQAANLFRSLGVGEDDAVAYVLPNATETVVTMIAGAVAGVVNPINPLLEPQQIASILRETGARVVVTLKPFPKTDVAQKVAEAVRLAPGVKTVLEVDLLRYLTPPKKWIVPLIRPKMKVEHHARVLDFAREVAKQPKTLTFADASADRTAAYFHTGGTTGMPKVARHRYSGMVYNGWLGAELLFTPEDTLICPLPLFHVFAVEVVLMAVLASGAHVVFPTPAGYRGEGVFDNFWKLIERWGVTFVITVPTAISALMQRKVDADVSTLKLAFSGSSPLPLELYRRFEAATGVTIVEGYGLTEATCLVSCNPPSGNKKVGSVGIPFPYTKVRILDIRDGEMRDCAPGEGGEICISSPGVWPGGTYTDESKNRGLFAEGRWLRTGDLGRIDEDGYLWITGRAKDLIIRGGHNLDPAIIEEALAGHEAVAFVGAVGQPDPHAGELPCAYVELVGGAGATPEELLEHAKRHIAERAAVPRWIEILPELPKTAVGKVFKPDLRKRAIARVLNEALEAAALQSRVASVIEDRQRGLTAHIRRPSPEEEEAVRRLLESFAQPWGWAAESRDRPPDHR